MHNTMSDRVSGKKRRQRKRARAKPLVGYPEYQDHAFRETEWVAQCKRAKEVDEAARSKGGPKERFPVKLMDMLHRAVDSDWSLIVRFQPHGRAFKVYDKTRFAKEVLPHTFQFQSDYASFLRQLNQYGFVRLTGQGPDQDAYYHELFLRGRLDLCELIPRHKDGARSTVRGTYDPTTQPNFYSMTALPSFASGGSRADLKAPPPTSTETLQSDEEATTALAKLPPAALHAHPRSSLDGTSPTLLCATMIAFFIYQNSI